VDPHEDYGISYEKFVWMCTLSILGGAKMRRKKKSIKPPFPKGVSVRIPVWISNGAFHPLPTEFPYGFLYGFHREHFIVPVGRELVNNNIF
jgi:hypothetical protein